ncbi:ribonuclease H-like domain-containing protein [Tanacetum coccineum]
MDPYVTSTPNSTKLPIIDTSKFEQWKFRIQHISDEATPSSRSKGRTMAITVEDMQKRRNDVKARTTLLLALPDEHQLRFNKYETAKELWEAILRTFGRNKATKKTKKNLLKQQYGNFKAEGSETLEQNFNRLQAIVSQLEFLDVPVQKKGGSSSQNMAFIFSSNTNSGKSEVPTAQSFSTASGQVTTASTEVATATFSHDTICAYIATKQSGSQIKYEDITQIYDDDIEEMEYGFAIYKKEEKVEEPSHKANRASTCEKIRVLERDLELKDYKIDNLTNELEKVKKERDGIDSKLEKFVNSSKNLDQMLETQRPVKDKMGLRLNEYSGVPPPPTQAYSSPMPDLSWTGLLEFTDNTVTDYTRPTPSVDVTNDVRSKLDRNNLTDCDQGGTSSNVVSKPIINFVKESGCPSASKVNNTENSRKPTVKYSEMYRNTSQSPRVRGNHRNWNNQKSQQLGSNFVMNNKACFACGSFNHLIKDCKRKVQKHVWNNARRVNHHNSHKMSYPHPKRNIVPKAVLMKTSMRPLNAARPRVRVNAAKQKAAYNVVKGNRFNAVKLSACWVWMPKNRVVDHVSQNIKDDLEDPSKQGRKIILIDKDHFCSDGCTNSGEAGVQQGKQRKKIKKKSRRFDSRTSSDDLHAGKKTKKMKCLEESSQQRNINANVYTVENMFIPTARVLFPLRSRVLGLNKWYQSLLRDFDLRSITYQTSQSQTEMDPYVTSTPNSIKLPILDTGKFKQWKFRIQQYLQHGYYALWEVIEFGDLYRAPAQDKSVSDEATPSSRNKGRTVAVTVEDMQKRRNDVKARTTMLLALPDEHQLRFSKYETAKELWEAILRTFGGNEDTKTTKKNLLKLQYRNFKAEGSKTLEQTINRLQAIVSQLEFLDVPVEQEDLN